MAFNVELNTKTEYFFTAGSERVYLSEFDYEYTRNSLLKSLDLADKSKIYKINVIVDYNPHGDDSTHDIFDVRLIDIKNLYYKSLNLNVYEKMIDDIIFNKKNKVLDLHYPPLYKMYMDNEANKKKAPALEKTKVAVKKAAPVRIIVSDFDNRIEHIKNQFPEYNPKVILDWVENFEICDSELTDSIRDISTSQMHLVSALKNSSEFINSVFDSLGKVLTENMNLNPGFFSRIFNSKVHVQESEIENVIQKIREVVCVDDSILDAAEQNLKTVSAKFDAVIETTGTGISACDYITCISTDENVQTHFSMRKQRLQKTKSAQSISQLQIQAFRQNFESSKDKLVEIQTVLVPLIFNRIIDCSGKFDNETVDLIRNIAVGKIDNIKK